MLLKAEKVSFCYTDGISLLQEVDFQVSQGEVVGLFGPSGCGKSTLAKLLVGRESPKKGHVLWDGKPLPKQGFSPVQIIAQHPERAVNPRWHMGRTLREAWCPPDDMLNAAGIEPSWEARWPNELSSGEIQRFCVVRALAPQTRILICDETTAMLDAITQAQMWSLILEDARRNNRGVVVISHNEHLTSRICDRVVYLKR